MWKRKLTITALMGAGLVGALVFDERQASRSHQGSWLLTAIGVPFCAPQRSGPQYKTFFRLAMAQAETANKPAKTEVGPFSKAIPDAESIANADANPVLMDDLGTLHYAITTAPYFAHAQFSDAKTILGLADPGADFPYVQAMWRYARAVGLANAGDVTAAQAEVDAIAQLAQANDFADLVAGGVPAKEVLRLAQHVARARIAQANKDVGGTIKHFELAVGQEDMLSYAEPPYWYYPTRQSLGAALLVAGDLDRAEEVLRASLARTPNNGWALFALMEVYKRRGDKPSAQAAKQLLDKAWMGDMRTLSLARF